nr:PQQ-dependent sugar dehydrogenase [Halomonas sp. 141]
MAWLPDDTLILTLGDGFDSREDAQRVSSHIGSIVRLNADGSVPGDNQGNSATPTATSLPSWCIHTE